MSLFTQTQFCIEESASIAFTGMRVGLLVVQDCKAGDASAYMAEEKRILARLRARYEGMDRKAIKALPPTEAYSQYYKRFGQNYPLVQQLESLLRGDKDLRAETPIIRAMFLAEMNGMLLTAGHDTDMLKYPLRLCAGAEEPYTSISGRETMAVKGDAYIRDEAGLLSSILRGPDYRTRITAETTNALFSVYAPAGVNTQAVLDGLAELEELLRLLAPGLQTQFKGILPADG